MNEKELKTSWKTRIVIGVIAFLMLFSTVAVYLLIIISNKTEGTSSNVASKELEKVQEDILKKADEIADYADKNLSKKYLEELKKYRSNVKSYNAQGVNDAGLKVRDLKVGTGDEIAAETEYYNYYIGFCPNETVFDSSFNAWENPSGLKRPLFSTIDGPYISGWEEGVIGMKLGGVREISIPGELAYGDKREICDGTNMPLKFIVMTIDPDEKYKELNNEYVELKTQYYVLYYSQHTDEYQTLDTNDANSSESNE